MKVFRRAFIAFLVIATCFMLNPLRASAYYQVSRGDTVTLTSAEGVQHITNLQIQGDYWYVQPWNSELSDWDPPCASVDDHVGYMDGIYWVTDPWSVTPEPNYEMIVHVPSDLPTGYYRIRSWVNEPDSDDGSLMVIIQVI